MEFWPIYLLIQAVDELNLLSRSVLPKRPRWKQQACRLAVKAAALSIFWLCGFDAVAVALLIAAQIPLMLIRRLLIARNQPLAALGAAAILHVSLWIALTTALPATRPSMIDPLMLTWIRWAVLIIWIGRPANILFKLGFSRFIPRSALIEDARTTDLPRVRSEPERQPRIIAGAGSWIGSFERVLAVIFMAISQYAAFGLLFAAKSIARYDRIAKDPGFSEYYLLGTLYSLLFATISYLAFFVILP